MGARRKSVDLPGWLAILLVALNLSVPMAGAGPPTPSISAPKTICTVPGTHATVQEAVDATECSEIVLAPGAFAESVSISRSLALRGAPSTIEGQVVVSGAQSTVTVNGLIIDASTLFSPLFFDGFESDEKSRLTGPNH